MSYFESVIRNFNSSKSDIKERLDVMTDDELKSVLEHMDEVHADLKQRVLEDWQEKVESNVHLFEVQIRELEDKYRLLLGDADSTHKSVRTLATAVIALGSAEVAFAIGLILMAVL